MIRSQSNIYIFNLRVLEMEVPNISDASILETLDKHRIKFENCIGRHEFGETRLAKFVSPKQGFDSADSSPFISTLSRAMRPRRMTSSFHKVNDIYF